jgi:hypothetical protein
MHNIYRGKKYPENVGNFCNFHKSAQSKQLRIGRRFDQSGHPDRDSYLVQGCQILLGPKIPKWEKYTK